MGKLGAAVVTVVVTLTVAAPAGQAAFRVRTEWPGGIRFGGYMSGLAIDPTGRTLVSRERKDVFRYSPSGHQTGRIRRVGSGRAIAVDSSGRVFTATASGTVTRWGTTGRREASFSTSNPTTALAIGPSGDLYVAG